MHQFFDSIKNNDRANATKTLDQIISTTPDWPYGYFYRGVITGNTNDFNKAAELFTLTRSVEITEPEPLLFEALNSAYLGDEQAAMHSLDAMENTHVQPSDVSLLFFPPHCSSEMLARLKPISDKFKMTSFNQH
jgi:lipoprotein NlpI